MLSAGTGLAAILLVVLPGRKRYRVALGLGLICVVSLAIGCGSASGGGGGGPVATTTKLTVTSATKQGAGGAFAFTVAVTGGTPTGQVQLLDGGTAIAGATAAVSGGSATFANVAMTTVGTHAISASYAGDAHTLASASGTLNVTVAGTTTVTVQSSPAASNGSLMINLTIN
jgi:Bacterial Ig-like domain (group 3)